MLIGLTELTSHPNKKQLEMGFGVCRQIVAVFVFASVLTIAGLWINSAMTNHPNGDLHSSAVAASASSGDRRPPNIIFFLLDDLGYADISAKGAEFVTPNLDAFYGNSIELESHYIGLLCSPSRSQILTGRYAWNMGLSSMNAFGHETISSLPPGVPTIGNLLKEYTDYATYAMTKWHVGYSTWEHTPLYRGFDHFYGFYGPAVDYRNKTSSGYIDWREDNDIDHSTQFTFSTWASRDRLLQIIDDHSTTQYLQETPFYAYAALQAPHEVLVEVDSIDRSNCDHVADEDSRLLYCENVMAIDELMGDIVAALKDGGLWDDTLIVFTSDNGGSYSAGGCNYPYRGGKSELFDGGVHTLALVGGGYLPTDIGSQGRKRKGLMHGSDWTPTLLALAGVDVDQVNQDLKNKLYEPVLQKASGGTSNDLMTVESFDGMDLSQWLMYGDESDNPRSSLGLSINSWREDEDDESQGIGVVFESRITSHTYKLIYSADQIGDYCQLWQNQVTGQTQRSQKHAQANGAMHLFDLTLDETEATNLYSSVSYSSEELTQLVEMYGKLTEYEEKKMQAMGDEHMREIENVLDYFVYSDSSELVSQLWDEGRGVAMGYASNPFFNEYSNCVQDTFFTKESNPHDFSDAYSPWWSFDEYANQMNLYCRDDFNDALMELYTTTYDEY